MNKEMLQSKWRYFDLVHDVTLRAIQAFSDKDLDYRPTSQMRSVRELIFHLYAQEKLSAEGVRDGFTKELEESMNPETEAGKKQLATLPTLERIVPFARNCHETSAKILASLSDQNLARVVSCSFGNYPGWQFFAFAYDEHWHHRGQLYTYLRLLGKEPLMLYDYPAPAA
jgi:uncharacterized damage-inducible protein DinB